MKKRSERFRNEILTLTKDNAVCAGPKRTKKIQPKTNKQEQKKRKKTKKRKNKLTVVPQKPSTQPELPKRIKKVQKKFETLDSSLISAIKQNDVDGVCKCFLCLQGEHLLLYHVQALQFLNGQLKKNFFDFQFRTKVKAFIKKLNQSNHALARLLLNNAFIHGFYSLYRLFSAELNVLPSFKSVIQSVILYNRWQDVQQPMFPPYEPSREFIVPVKNQWEQR